jgi:hypothetical protein
MSVSGSLTTAATYVLVSATFTALLLKRRDLA